MKLVPGTWYLVTWLDAVQSSNGDPKHGQPIVRQQMLMFHRSHTHEFRGIKSRSVVFALGEDQGEQTETGWLALPCAMILIAERVAPRTRLKKEEIASYGKA